MEQKARKEEQAAKAEAPKPRTKGSRRARRKLFLAAGGLSIAAIIALLLFAGAGPSGYLTVSEARNGPYLYKEVKVRGDVTEWNAKAHKFILTDNVSTLPVDYNNVPGGAPPSFAAGKHVVVRGLLQPGYLQAEEITVGCPTDYGDG
jgi:cytochrome c-type biogenesis protein CcmE